MPAAPHRPLLIALIVSCAFFMQHLDGTVIATALPQMARSFREAPVNVSIGITAYLLTLAVFIPTSGWVADRFGSRTIFATRDRRVHARLGAVRVLRRHAVGVYGRAHAAGIGGAMMVPVGRLVVLRAAEKHELIRLDAVRSRCPGSSRRCSGRRSAGSSPRTRRGAGSSSSTSRSA